MPLTQPHIARIVISPADQKRMEAASGFKQGLPPKKTLGSTVGLAKGKPALSKLREPLQENILLQFILMIMFFVVLAVIGTLLRDFL